MIKKYLIFFSFLMALGFEASMYAQTRGYITYPLAPATTNPVLDPNGDHFTSASTSGFLGDDLANSEIPYVAIPSFVSTEPDGDLRRGPVGQYSELVPDANGDALYMYFDGTNILMRLRISSSVNGAKGYSVLFDADLKFGPSGPNADPNFIPTTNGTDGNPGFEYEVVYEAGKRIAVYAVDGLGKSGDAINPLATFTLANFQQSFAATNNSGTLDYFFDFYVPFSVFTSPSFNPGTQPFRASVTTCMSPAGAILGTKSDVYGDDDDFSTPEDQWIDDISEQSGCALADIQNNTCDNTVRCTSPPTINGPLAFGASVGVSGTWTKSDYSTVSSATITLFKISGTDTTVLGTASTTSGSSWNLSNLSIAEGDFVYATAQGAGENACSTSDLLRAGCTGGFSPCPAITNTCLTKGIAGTGVPGATIRIYDPLSATPSIPVWSSVVLANGTWGWSGSGTTGNTTNVCTGNADVVGVHFVTQEVSGSCESLKQSCSSVSPDCGKQTAVSVITNSSTYPGAIITGTAELSADVSLYYNGLVVETVSASATTGEFQFDLAPYPLAIGDILSVSALSTTTNNACVSNLVTALVTCFVPAPIISANDVGYIEAGVPISGTSSEISATVSVYETAGNTLIGTATVSATGTWQLSQNAVVGTSYYATQANGCGTSAESATVTGFTQTSASRCGAITGSITAGATSVSGTLATAVANTTVTLYADGIAIGTPALTSGTSWTVTGLSATMFDENYLASGAVLTIGIAETGQMEVMCPNSLVVSCSAPANPTYTVAPDPTNLLYPSQASYTISNSVVGVLYTLQGLNGATDAFVNYSNSVLGNGSSIVLASNFPDKTVSYALRIVGINLITVSCDAETIGISANVTGHDLFAGSVFLDIDGLTDNAIDGSGIQSPAAQQLYVTLVDNLGNVVASTPVAADGSYQLPPVEMDGDYLIQLSINQGVVSQPAPAIALPSGWAFTGEGSTTTGDSTPDGSYSYTVSGLQATTGLNFGIQQLPTSGITVDNGTVDATNTLKVALFNQGFIGETIIPNPAFGGSDPEGNISKLVIESINDANIQSITTGGITFYRVGELPSGCVNCAEIPSEGIIIPTNASGQPTQAVSFTPIPNFIDGTLSLDYKVMDIANGLSVNVATLTMPIVALKFDLSGANTGWYNGSGTSDKPDASDGDKTLFWVSSPTNSSEYLDIDAVVNNLIVYPGVDAVVTGCLTVNENVVNDGTVSFKAITESQYGQYLGPEMPNVTFEMVLNESGWHNIAFPVKGTTGSPLTAQDLANQNNTPANPEVVNLSNNPATHNLWWYDSRTSGGQEHGFFIDRSTTGVPDLNATYSTHAYGTWNMVAPTEVLNTHGYNYFINENFVSSLPYSLIISGIANDAGVTVSTHNNFGGWNLIPNPFPVTIDPQEMFNDGFFGSDFDNAIWIWDPGDAYTSPIPGQFSTGAYIAVDAETGLAISGSNANTISTNANLVAPMQAFYIRRTTASTVRRKDGGSLDAYAPNAAVAAGIDVDPAVSGSNIDVTVKPEYRTNCNIVKHYKTNWDLIWLRAFEKDNPTQGDALEIVFDDKYTSNFDIGFDVAKIGSSPEGPTFFSILENSALTINKQPYPTEVTEVPLGFYAQQDGLEYAIESIEAPDGWQVFLEDKLTGAWHNLSDKAYNFRNNTGFQIDRFVVYFSMQSSPIERPQPKIVAWVTAKGIEVNFENITDIKAEVLVSNITGQIVHNNKTVSTEENYHIPIQSNMPQMYLITVVTSAQRYVLKVVR